RSLRRCSGSPRTVFQSIPFTDALTQPRFRGLDPAGVGLRAGDWERTPRRARSAAARQGGDGYALGRRRPPPQYAARVATVSERIGAGRFVSFELWPPRSAESASALEAALDELAGLGPAFVAITYGAGGSTRERTHDLV